MTALALGFHPNIPVDQLTPHPSNPRKSLGDLGDLTASVQVSGVIEPLVVLPDGTLVCGHRRHAAATQAGLPDVPVVVRDLDPIAQRRTMLEENVHRNALTALEEADAFAELEALGKTQHEIAEMVSVSQSHVSKRIGLRRLVPIARQALEAGTISVDQALTVATLTEDRQTKVWTRFGGKPDPAKPLQSWAIDEQLRKQLDYEKNTKRLEQLRAKGDKVRWLPQNTKIGYDTRRDPVVGLGRFYPKVAGHSKLDCHAYVLVDKKTNQVEQVCTAPASHLVHSGSAGESTVVKAEDRDTTTRDELIAQQDRRREFIANLPPIPWDIAVPYAIAAIADGIETYDEATAMLARYGIDRPEDDMGCVTLWRAAVASPADAVRWLHNLALDTLEQALTIAQWDLAPKVREDCEGVAQMHFDHLSSLGYQLSPAEMVYVGRDAITGLGVDSDQAEQPQPERPASPPAVTRRPLGDKNDPGCAWEISCAECGVVYGAVAGARSEQLANYHQIGHTNPAGAAEYAELHHLDIPAGDDEWETPQRTEPVHDVDVRRKPRTKTKWLVSCNTCGFIAEQTTEAYANERAEAHGAHPENDMHDRHAETAAAVAS